MPPRIPTFLPGAAKRSTSERIASERGFVSGLAAKIIGFGMLGAIAAAGLIYGIVNLLGDTSPESIASGDCNQAEIVDFNLWNVRRLGDFFGTLPCVPVCVWHNDDDLLLEPDELGFHRELGGSVSIDTSGVIAPNSSYLFQTPNTTFGPDDLEIALLSITPEVPSYKVQADGGQNQCRLVDAQGEPVPDGTAIELEAKVLVRLPG